jgi:hypothetical protein
MAVQHQNRCSTELRCSTHGSVDLGWVNIPEDIQLFSTKKRKIGSNMRAVMRAAGLASQTPHMSPTLATNL